MDKFKNLRGYTETYRAVVTPGDETIAVNNMGEGGIIAIEVKDAEDTAVMLLPIDVAYRLAQFVAAEWAKDRTRKFAELKTTESFLPIRFFIEKEHLGNHIYCKKVMMQALGEERLRRLGQDAVIVRPATDGTTRMSDVACNGQTFIIEKLA